MIQRIQSIFLFAIGILLAINLFVSFWTARGIEKTSGIDGHIFADPVAVHFVPNGQASMENRADTYYIGGLSLLASLLASFALFQFKSRKLQITLCSLNYLFIAGILGCYFLAIDTAKGIFELSDNGQYTVGFFLPIAAIILNFLAIRYIKKDEELVRSVDRIR